MNGPDGRPTTGLKRAGARFRCVGGAQMLEEMRNSAIGDKQKVSWNPKQTAKW